MSNTTDTPPNLRKEAAVLLPSPRGKQSERPTSFKLKLPARSAQGLKDCGYATQILYGRQVPYNALVRAGLVLLTVTLKDALMDTTGERARQALTLLADVMNPTADTDLPRIEA